MTLKRSESPVRIAFFLVPQFSMMSFATAIEPLRSANRAAARPVFEWVLASADGAPVTASNGIPVAVTGTLEELANGTAATAATAGTGTTAAATATAAATGTTTAAATAPTTAATSAAAATNAATPGAPNLTTTAINAATIASARATAIPGPSAITAAAALTTAITTALAATNLTPTTCASPSRRAVTSPASRKLDMVLVCSGLDTPPYPTVYPLLRRLNRHGVLIGGISTGPFVLAEAGLLHGKKCTVHWEYADAFRARYPQLDLTQDLYVIDGDVLTCSGGTAALDMMLHIVKQVAGTQLAMSVAEQFIHSRIREREDHQRLDLHARYGIDHPKLIQSIALMERTLDDPLEMADIAHAANLSVRQLERLFRRYLESSPQAFYRQLRLARARTLLRYTLTPLRMIALDCGFESTSHFCHAYKRVYGIPPTHERPSRQLRSPASSRPSPVRDGHPTLPNLPVTL